MTQTQLPPYLAAARPNPIDQRGPWYKNTAPSYAGIFLSVPFMAGMAGAVQYGSLSAAIVGLVIGALFCFALYYVPALLGLRTGMPLYVVGASTFGTHGGIVMPGLLMGVLQIGWHAVFTFSAASFFMTAIGSDAGPGSALFWVVCAVWGLAFAMVGAVGIKWLSWLSGRVPIFPLLMIVIAALANSSGLGNYQAALINLPQAAVLVPLMGLGAFAALQATAGFFATAGAAGADFATNSRDQRDVVWGGFVGVTLAALVAGLCAIITIAGALGKDPTLVAATKVGIEGFDPFATFINSIAAVGGFIANIMSWVFVIACICPTGFCAFLAGNSFSTMFPKLPRTGLTLAAGAAGVILAATGVANNLVGFFLIIGASFGPIIGAMTADYLRHGGWKGPRAGINWAGYLAWAAGFVVGIWGSIPHIGFPYGLETLMSFVVGFAVYAILAEMGLEPPAVALPGANNGSSKTQERRP